MDCCSKKDGWLFAINIVGLMIVSFKNRTLVKHHTLDTLLKVATSSLVAAMLMLALSVNANFGGIFIIVAMLLYFFISGIIAASATAAQIGLLLYGSGIVSSLLLAAFQDGTPWPMALIMVLFTVASAATVLFKGPIQ
ncbi:MAG: hypothetical protein PHI97_28180 [Desulfobulbus sp.]|nr:hypothetical protein [Desulfobulbus sp.]